MKNKYNKKLKIIIALFIALCILLFSCGDNGKGNGNGNDNGNGGEYNNPNAGQPQDQSRDISFSHDSGQYSSGFSLTLTPVVEGHAIYYTLDGSEPVPGKAGTVQYTAPISVINRTNPVQPNVLATPENIEQMNMYPWDSRHDNPPADIYIPNNEQVPKATVIRAIAIDTSGRKSEIATRTYFVGTNAQLFGNTNVRIISLVSDPEGLVSTDRGIMVRGGPDKRWNDWEGPPYNFQQRGEAWERVAAFELFDGNKNRLLSTNLGIRVRGGYSRGAGQKSFNFYFRREHGGINNFVRSEHSFELIPGAVKANGTTPVDITKGFMLRSGGNDMGNTKFYDVFIHDLLKDRNFTTQAAVPVILYLNGEYWGPYNMQERYSDNHTEYKYGVNRDNVISIDNGQLDDGFAGEHMSYFDAVNDMINTENYSEFCSKIDIDNFIDYWAAQIYIYNQDWPQNNYIVWRTRNTESGNPYGDTKWRYSLHDTEFALGIYSGGLLENDMSIIGVNRNGDTFERLMEGNHEHHQLFRALIKNAEFKKKFVSVMLELYNKNFHPDNFEPKLNYYVNLYSPLMGRDLEIPGYHSRWEGDPNYWRHFNEWSNNARTYLTNFRYALPGYLQTYLSTSVTNITLSTTLSNTTITINGFTPNASGSWTGLFDTTGGVTITASAAPSGYEFDGWSITGGTAADPSSTTTTVSSLADNAVITAKYKQVGITVIEPESIAITGTVPANLRIGDTFTLTASFTPSDTTYQSVTWSSSRPNIIEVNSAGRVTIKGGGTATITATSTIDSSVIGTKDITAHAVFMAEPHEDGIKLIIDVNLMPNYYKTTTYDGEGNPENKELQFRPSGWGNGARVNIGSINWATDSRFLSGKYEFIYPFTNKEQPYSIEVEIDGTLHSITEIPGGGVGILSREGSISYDNGIVSYSATLNNVDFSKVSGSELRRGWALVYLKGRDWNIDWSYGWNEIAWWREDDWDLGIENTLNYNITTSKIYEIFPHLSDGGEIFALLYYRIEYNGITFDMSDINKTFYFDPIP